MFMVIKIVRVLYHPDHQSHHDHRQVEIIIITVILHDRLQIQRDRITVMNVIRDKAHLLDRMLTHQHVTAVLHLKQVRVKITEQTLKQDLQHVLKETVKRHVREIHKQEHVKIPERKQTEKTDLQSVRKHLKRRVRKVLLIKQVRDKIIIRTLIQIVRQDRQLVPVVQIFKQVQTVTQEMRQDRQRVRAIRKQVRNTQGIMLIRQILNSQAVIMAILKQVDNNQLRAHHRHLNLL